MKYEKKFIAFEGLDGSGKGTQIEIIKKYYELRNRNDVVFTFEPTKNSPWAEKINEILYSKDESTSIKDLQLLFVLDRKYHIENFILPALKKNKIVYTDRYFLSTLAYGSYGGDIHWKTLLNYHKEVLRDLFIVPSITIYIDVSPDVALSRISFRGEDKSIFERRQKLEKVREAYVNIGKHFEGFNILDGSGTPEEVFEETRVVLKNYL